MVDLINAIENSFDTNTTRIAICKAENNITYSELKTEVYQLIDWLSSFKVSRNSKIGIAVKDPYVFCKCVITVTCFGGCYVPIDISASNKRKNEMIQCAGLDVVICEDLTWINGVEINAKVAYIPSTLPESFQNSPFEFRSDDEPLNIMFTSGSTGSPKGVICPVGGIIPLVTGNCHIPINKDDRVLQISARSFDAFTWELWGTLLNGACLVLPPEDWSIRSITEFIQIQNITVAFFTSRLFDSLIESYSNNLAKMRMISFGGESASAQHVRLAKQTLPNVQIFNCYGPSENTTFTTSYLVENELGDATRVPIGQSAGGDETIVVDPTTLEIKLDSVIGELWVTGPGIAIGYTDESLTAERFTVHPKTGKRYFRTGDLVESDTKGIFTWIGRIDREVKVRGKRVDLDDIENSILKYDDISIVSVLHNLMGQGEIIAFYSTSSGEKIDTRNLIQFLKREVILEGIPRHFEHLNSIPMNAHGKIDRNSLAHNFKTKISKVIEGNELKAIWKQYLPTAEILPETHFFEDGGDSLSALNLINEVEELMGLNLEVNFLSKFPKFDRFCEMIYKHRSNLKLLNSSKTDTRIFVFLPPIVDDRAMPFLHLSASMESLNYQIIDYKSLFSAGQPKSISEFSKTLYNAISELKPAQIVLVGHSSAGVFALDVASHFESVGSKVESVIMLDSFPAVTRLNIRIQTVCKKYIFSLGILGRIINPRPLKNNHTIPDELTENSLAIISLGKHIGSWFEVFKIKIRIPCSTRIVLIKAVGNEQQKVYREIKENGWKRKIPRIEVFEFNAEHTSMLNHKNAGELGELIKRIT